MGDVIKDAKIQSSETLYDPSADNTIRRYNTENPGAHRAARKNISSGTFIEGRRVKYRISRDAWVSLIKRFMAHLSIGAGKDKSQSALSIIFSKYSATYNYLCKFCK